jgi:hypothetical protein
MNEKEIITKLLALATTQQKIIHKLAQVPADPNVAYLKRSAEVAATNAGIKVPISAWVNPKDDMYIITITGLEDANQGIKEHFIKTYQTSIRLQKPELEDKVSIVFTT